MCIHSIFVYCFVYCVVCRVVVICSDGSTHGERGGPSDCHHHQVCQDRLQQAEMPHLLHYCKGTSLAQYMLMRNEKEGRKKQAMSDQKQGKATQHIQSSHFSKEK